MHQRDFVGGHLKPCNDACTAKKVMLGTEQMQPKFWSQNCAVEKCYRHCLTYYCDEHYPQKGDKTQLFALFEIAARCGAIYGRHDVRHFKALVNFFDSATMCWDSLTEDERGVIRQLLNTHSDFLLPEGHEPCSSTQCDVFRRYFFMLDNKGEEFRPLVQ